MGRRAYRPFFVIIAFLFTGCTSFTSLPVQYPVPGSGVTVAGDTIMHDGKPFAELRYYFTLDERKSPEEAYRLRAPVQHRGIALYYHGHKQLVWIFPERGLERDREQGFYKALDRDDYHFGWVFDITIAKDGRNIYYKIPEKFHTSRYRYSVAKGASIRVDRKSSLGSGSEL